MCKCHDEKKTEDTTAVKHVADCGCKGENHVNGACCKADKKDSQCCTSEVKDSECCGGEHKEENTGCCGDKHQHKKTGCCH